MGEVDIVKLVILCFVIGLAQFVDAIAGGGGTVSAPAYLALGFPPHITLGTAKCSSVIASAVTVFRFGRRRLFDMKLVIFASLSCFAGSMLGARLALGISERVLQIIMITVLPVVAFYIILRPGQSAPADDLSDKRGELNATGLFKGAVLSFFIGIYEGILGPGTGTFLIMVFTGVLGLDMLKASGTAKMVNYAGTLAAFLSFLAGGKVLLAYALPTAVCGMIGSFLGSGLAFKKGEKIIRPMMLLVVGLLFLKIIYDFISG